MDDDDSGVDFIAYVGPVTVVGVSYLYGESTGAVTSGGAIIAMHALAPRPPAPAYKDGQIWRCGQQCAGIDCKAPCYHPIEVPHEEHGCCMRLRLLFMRAIEMRERKLRQQ